MISILGSTHSNYKILANLQVFGNDPSNVVIKHVTKMCNIGRIFHSLTVKGEQYN